MEQTMVNEQGTGTFVPPLKVDVRVHALMDDGLGVLFALGGTVHQPKAREKVTAHSIDVQEGSPHVVRFTLIDHTNLHLQFDRSEPFIAQAGLDCPTRHDAEWTFEMDTVLQAREQLQVRNPGSKGVFTYSLIFRDVQGNKHDCDPIIKNFV